MSRFYDDDNRYGNIPSPKDLWEFENPDKCTECFMNLGECTCEDEE